ncbi:MAG: hypothetical protein NZ933_00545 [Bacteroidia bacterium]|nr:hypothetical protein [Bacteroidia bacterium]
MRVFLVWLAGSCLYAQSAGVWHWHHYSTQGNGVPAAGWEGSPPFPYNSILGKTVVVGDTVYVLGTISHPSGGQGLYLPNSSVELTGTNGGDFSTYVIAYRRADGNFLWAAHFFPTQAGGARVRGTDLLVAPDHTVFVLLSAYSPSSSGRLEGMIYYGSSRASLSLSANAIDTYYQSYLIRFWVQGGMVGGLAVKRFFCGDPLSVGCGGFEVNLFSLLLVGDKLWVSGTVVNSGHNSLSISDVVDNSFLTLLDQLFNWGGIVQNPTPQAVLIRMQANNLEPEAAAVYRGNNANNLDQPNCYGRLIFPFGDDTVAWMVVQRENGSVRFDATNGGSTPENSNAAAVRLLLIMNTSNSMLMIGGGSLVLANFLSPSSYPPPQYYGVLALHTKELYWAVVDTAGYSVGSFPAFPQTPFPRMMLNRTGLSTVGSASYTAPVVSSSLRRLNLSGIAYERVGNSDPYIYLSGTLEGTEWQLVEGLSSGPVSLPGANSLTGRASFVLGLRHGTSGWKFSGYKRILSSAPSPLQQEVVVAGMGKHPVHPQLYLFGWSRDSFIVEPRWSDGRSDTVRPSSLNSPPRLWVGRLDIYRISSSGSLENLCVPDSINPPNNLHIAGTWNNMVKPQLIWVPKDPNRRYRANHGWAAILTDSLNSLTGEGYVSASRDLIIPGRLMEGDYFLALRTPVLRDSFAEVGDTLSISVEGTTIPYLQRGGALRWYRIVKRFAGGGNSLPLAPITGSFYRKSHRFENINGLLYFPWKNIPTPPINQENLYLLDYRAQLDTLILYSIELNSGEVHSLRGWSRAQRGSLIFADPFRGEIWSQLNGDRVVLYKLHPTNPALDDSVVIQTGSLSFAPSSEVGYPLGYPQKWVLNMPRSFTVTEYGDIVGIVGTLTFSAGGGYTHFLARIDSKRDSIVFVAGGQHNSSCSQDGIGFSAALAGFPSNLTSEGDTLYWVESNPNPQGCEGPLLRKAWPVSSDRRFYEVLSIDTLEGGIYQEINFSRVPKRGLYMAVESMGRAYLLWYDLADRTVDTLLRCADLNRCCQYGLSEYIVSSFYPFVVLRGGNIIYVDRYSKGLDIALPVRKAGQGDTLIAESFISASSINTYSQDTLYLSPPSDSTWLSVRVCGIGKEKPFWYGSELFSPPTIRFVAPDTVCEGMQFSSFIQLRGGFREANCEVGISLISQQSTENKVEKSPFSVDSYQRWKAISAGYDTIEVSFSSGKWDWLLGNSVINHPIRIRRGYRVRMRASLEGPWVSTLGRSRWMKPHPFLTRALIANYNQGVGGVTADSLWRLPLIRADSLVGQWNIWLTDPSASSCPDMGPWFCDTSWVGIARVDLHDAATGDLLDSTYALVDTVGRLYFYRAPLSSIDAILPGLNRDTLHFCYCDPIPSQYFVLRTPNHLPLYSVPVSFMPRGMGEADSLDLTDPSLLQGIPEIHYTLRVDSSHTLLPVRAAAWAGNCADLYNSFLNGPHYDEGVVNAADLEFLLPRNGVTSGLSWADLDGNGVVEAGDALILIRNQNRLVQSIGP